MGLLHFPIDQGLGSIDIDWRLQSEGVLGIEDLFLDVARSHACLNISVSNADEILPGAFLYPWLVQKLGIDRWHPSVNVNVCQWFLPLPKAGSVLMGVFKVDCE